MDIGFSPEVLRQIAEAEVARGGKAGENASVGEISGQMVGPGLLHVPASAERMKHRANKVLRASGKDCGVCSASGRGRRQAKCGPVSTLVTYELPVLQLVCTCLPAQARPGLEFCWS